MGLLKAASETVSSILADQWLEYFYCDSLAENVLVEKAQKRTTRNSSNKSGNEFIISNGSKIAVADGQCMMIVDQGKIIDYCSAPGLYSFDVGGEPSFFGNRNFNDNLMMVLKSTFDRFSYGGTPGKDTRIYFFNTKELMGNKFGTPSPVPFRVVDTNIGLDIDVSIRCFGEYSYKITNPMLFYKNISGNLTERFLREEIDGQLKSELLSVLMTSFSRVSAKGIRYSSLPGHTDELISAMNDELTLKWRNTRGIEVASVGISSIKASEEDEKIIKNLQQNAVLRNPSMAAATLVSAQADALKSAANNENGAMLGFMGLGLAQSAGGVNSKDLFELGQKQDIISTSKKMNGWDCNCGQKNNTGKFCIQCGSIKPKVNRNKCDKCGWESADNSSSIKYCPECGNHFEDENIK